MSTPHGQCKTPTLIYPATVEKVTSKETYVGLSALPFKNRFYGHKGSITHEDRKKETTLSKTYLGAQRSKFTFHP